MRWPTKFHESSVMNIFDYIVPISLIAVLIVLLLGLRNMMRGGSANTSQKLMRWRVILQFLTVCIVMAAIFFAGK